MTTADQRGFVATFFEEHVVKPLQSDPERVLREARRRAHTRYFLRRFSVHCPACLEDLQESWGRNRRELLGPASRLAAYAVDSNGLQWKWFVEKYFLPDTHELRMEIFNAETSWREWMKYGRKPPLAWGMESMIQLWEELDEREPPVLPGPGIVWSGPFGLQVPGWNTLESEEQFKARVEAAFREGFRSYLEAAKLMRKAMGDEELLLAEPTYAARSQLDLLAEYQAKPELSMKDLARREKSTEPSVSTIRNRLHRAAELIGLPRERLRHAPKRKKKT